MEIETSSMSISFDKLLNNYGFLSQIPLDQISKVNLINFSLLTIIK